MNDYLAFALSRARAHTLSLVADIPPEAIQIQSNPLERNPVWLLGHLLLADVYLLSLLGAEPISDDFQLLLAHYGPSSAPTSETPHHSKRQLVDRLTRTNGSRLTRIQKMVDSELARAMPDVFLAEAQPT